MRYYERRGRMGFQRLHACFGVLCERHRTCARYLFGDGSTEPSTYWLATCSTDGTDERPGYIDIDFIGPPAPGQFTLTRHGRIAIPVAKRRAEKPSQVELRQCDDTGNYLGELNCVLQQSTGGPSPCSTP